jgi:hypothetical protein
MATNMKARWVFAPSFMAALGAIACQTLLGIDPNPIPSVAWDSGAPPLTDAGGSSDASGKDSTGATDGSGQETDSCRLSKPPSRPEGADAATDDDKLAVTFLIKSFAIPRSDNGFDLDGFSSRSNDPSSVPCTNLYSPYQNDITNPSQGVCGIDTSFNTAANEIPGGDLIKTTMGNLDASADLCSMQWHTITLSKFNGLANDSNVIVSFGITPKALPSPKDAGVPDASPPPSDANDDQNSPTDASSDPNPCRLTTSGTGTTWDPSIRTWEFPTPLHPDVSGYVSNGQLVVELPAETDAGFALPTEKGLLFLAGGYLVAEIRVGEEGQKLSPTIPLQSMQISSLRLSTTVASTVAMSNILALITDPFVQGLLCPVADMPFPPLPPGASTTKKCSGVSLLGQLGLTPITTSRTDGAAPPDLKRIVVTPENESRCQ